MVGDRFKAKPRSNVPERAKPTLAQQQARRENIKKAQAADSGNNKKEVYDGNSKESDHESF